MKLADRNSSTVRKTFSITTWPTISEMHLPRIELGHKQSQPGHKISRHGTAT